MKLPTDLEIRRLIENHKERDIRNEFKKKIIGILSNTKHLGFKKIEVTNILDYSLFNLKLHSQIFFRDHLDILKKILDSQDNDITLYKTKEKVVIMYIIFFKPALLP